MKIKKLLSLLLCIVMLLSVTACDYEDIIIKDDTSEEAEDDTPDTGKTPDSEDEQETVPADTVIGNGQHAIQEGDTLYYWTISDDGCTLVSKGSTETQLYTASERGDIYAMGDKLYVNQSTDSGKKLHTVCIDPATGSTETIADVNVAGIHPDATALILKNRNNTQYYLCTPEDGQVALDPIFDTYYYCGFGQDSAYFYINPSDDKTTVILYAMDLSTQALTELSTSKIDHDYSYGSACEIPFLQETEEAVYYSYGYLSGSGNYYQMGGGFVRVDADGSEKFAEMIGFNDWYNGPEFYVFQKDGVEWVRFASDKVKLWNSATGEITEENVPLGTLGQPFITQNSTYTEEYYWIYPDTTGAVVELMPANSVDRTSEYNQFVQNLCYVGDYTFYDVVYHKPNPTPDSWRDATIAYKQELYQYNRVTGETTLIGTVSLA